MELYLSLQSLKLGSCYNVTDLCVLLSVLSHDLNKLGRLGRWSIKRIQKVYARRVLGYTYVGRYANKVNSRANSAITYALGKRSILGIDLRWGVLPLVDRL